MQSRIPQPVVVIFTLVLMVMTCEVATRLFSRAPRDVSQRDPLIGRRYQVNLSETNYNREAGGGIYLRTNRLGFRGPEVAATKATGIQRVAVLGDSYTASEALPEEQTYCALLQELLNEQDRAEQYEVLNFGIPGAGTGQQLALYRNVVRKLDVDVVVIAFGNATDVRDNSSELGTNPIIYFEVDDSGQLIQVPQSESRVTLSNWLNQSSYFYHWQKNKISSLKRRVSKQTKQVRGRHLIYARKESPEYRNAWELTAAILKTFRDECRNDGVRLIVAGIPAAHQIHADRFAELQALCAEADQLDPSHPDHRLSNICRDLSIPFLSLTESFRRRSVALVQQNRNDSLFFNRLGHLNAAGSRVAAEQLSAWMTEAKVAALPVRRQ